MKFRVLLQPLLAVVSCVLAKRQASKWCRMVPGEAQTQRWQGVMRPFRAWAAGSAWSFLLPALLCVSLAHAQILDLLHKEQICTVWYEPSISEMSKKYWSY